MINRSRPRVFETVGCSRRRYRFGKRRLPPSGSALIDQKATSKVRGELYCGLTSLIVQTLGCMRLTFWELSWDVQGEANEDHGCVQLRQQEVQRAL
uniref:Calcium uniporter protein C-terminal domain-containing protein n=1 Tax=Lactuca sativa TaxID=4236 RepID=A0A9R1UJK7_LACSA|nr:hypothetical protein LSAT_V11C900455790 [Lactuca sativa]